jgi:hypothetical protein
MTANYDALVSRLRMRHPSAHVAADVFPSGCACIDASVAGRKFVIDCRPGE